MGFVNPRQFIYQGIKFLFLFSFLQFLLLQIYCIEGTSMEPTLRSKFWVLVNPLKPLMKFPERNEIIVFKLNKSNDILIKRLIGLPGERIEFYEGKLYIDGVPSRENFSHLSTFEDFDSYTIPTGHVLVIGDNRSSSMDSRSFGAIPIRNIFGTGSMILWPFNKISFL
ncbi:signal peptidase I [Candidatus Riflebacteria bacterium]